MGSDRAALIGRLVHRLFETEAGRPDDEVLARVRALVRAEERAVVEDLESVVAAAVSIWRSMRERADLVELFKGATITSEVPFSMRVTNGARVEIVRGTIDSIVQRPDGTVTVLEFKTGTPESADQAQLDLYVRAAAVLFPAAAVTGRLIYSARSGDGN